MSWFRVDDRFYSSRKVLAIRRAIRTEAIGLWVLAGTWSSGEELDGRVPDYIVEELGGSEEAARALVDAGLWSHDDEGYLFLNWAEYQPTRADKEAAREAERLRKADWRARKSAKKQANEGSPGVVPDVSRRDMPGVPVVSPLTRPDPTRPDPTPITPSYEGVSGGTPAAAPQAERPNSKGTRIPDPFVVTGEMREWAAREVPGLDVDRVTASFCDYWRAKAGRDAVKRDWVATWRNWLRRDFDSRGSRGSGPAGSPHSARTLQALSVVEQYADEPPHLEGITA